METFSVQRNKDLSHHKDPISSTTLAVSVPEVLKRRGRPKTETMFEAQTRAAHDLGELLRLKTEQINIH